MKTEKRKTLRLNLNSKKDREINEFIHEKASEYKSENDCIKDIIWMYSKICNMEDIIRKVIEEEFFKYSDQIISLASPKSDLENDYLSESTLNDMAGLFSIG